MFFFFFFSDPKTEQKNNSEREGYVYDFYYPSDNYGRLGKMWVLDFVKGWCGDSLPWFKLKFLKQRKALNYIDCKQADNVPIQPQGNLKSWRAYRMSKLIEQLIIKLFVSEWQNQFGRNSS